MKAVGIRELKGNLSRYLRKVQAGEGIVVTDRAKEIAVILPYKLEGEEEKVLGLIQQGLATWSGGKPAGLSSRIRSKGKAVSDAVLEDRT